MKIKHGIGSLLLITLGFVIITIAAIGANLMAFETITIVVVIAVGTIILGLGWVFMLMKLKEGSLYKTLFSYILIFGSLAITMIYIKTMEPEKLHELVTPAVTFFIETWAGFVK